MHHRDRPAVIQAENDNTRLKYFQRKAGQPGFGSRNSNMSATSNANSEHLEDIDAYPSISTAYQFADFVFTSTKASSESHTLAFLITRVRHDVSEASRLYLSPAVANFLEAWPDKKSWIDNIQTDISRLLNDIGSSMETLRVGGDEGGAIGIRRRFEWLSGHQKKLLNKQQLLLTSHQSLMAAINIMQTVELCGATTGKWQDPIHEAPAHPWVKCAEGNVLRGPYSRREFRQKNFSVSSFHLPQPEAIETVVVNTIPSELPGSTPEDIYDTNRRSLLGSPPVRRPRRRTSARDSYLRSGASSSTTSNSITIMSLPTSSSPPKLEQIQLQSPIDSNFVRGSFDQYMPISATLPQHTRRSLDSTIPEEHTEQLQHRHTYPAIARPRSDFDQPLATVVENTIERNDSGTSGIVAMPQVAKRYPVNPVYIRRQPGRRRSLPSELPYIQSQSSLTEDLANWMSLPGIQSEKLPSIEWDASSGVGSSSISVASCPAVTQAPAEDRKHEVTVVDEADKTSEVSRTASTRSVTRDDGLTHEIDNDAEGNNDAESVRAGSSTHLDPFQDNLHSRERAPSIISTTSSITRKPLSQTPSLHTTLSTLSLTSTINDPQSSNIRQTVSLPYPGQSSAIHDSELSFQRNLMRQSYPSDIPPPVPPKEPFGAHATQTQPGLSSAQAKRRAAHQRRMELAFGQNKD